MAVLPLSAQQVPAPPARSDSVSPDTTRRTTNDARRTSPDSTARPLPDSLNPDSLRPIMPPLGPPPGPLPASRRFVFDNDALRWSGQLTLGELLNLVPGVFLVRAGWYGMPETVSYGGQGAASVELYQDGYAIDPLGTDSAGFDSFRFDIGLYRRIEVEVLPTVLRVYLISDTQAARRPRTEASFSAGDASTNSYRLRYLNRWSNGAGINIGATYFGTTGPPSALGKVGLFQVLTKFTWMVSDRAGMEVTFGGFNLTREKVTPVSGGTPLPGVDARRSDLVVRAFAATRSDGMGLRLDAVLGNSSFSDTSGTLDGNAGQASLTLSYRASHWSAEAWGRLRDGTNPWDGGARGSWSPLRPVTLTTYLRRRSIVGGGGYSEAANAVEFRPLRALALHGDVRWRRLSDSMFVTADTTQQVVDWSGGATLTGRLLSLDVSYSRRAPFTAPVFGLFQTQLPGVSVTGTDAWQVAWRIQPRPWLTLSGWLRNPTTDSVPFDPPTHSLSRITFRSMFLPHFRHGAFDLMLQGEMEAWGHGVAGYSATGAPIPLAGKTLFNIYAALRLVGAQLYWTLHNTQRERYAIIPGYEMPRSLQRFGVRWEFTN